MERDLKITRDNIDYYIDQYLRNITERDFDNEKRHGITFKYFNVSYFDEEVCVQFWLTHVPMDDGIITNDLWETIKVELLDSKGNRIGQNQFPNIYNISEYDLSAHFYISASCAYDDIAKIVVNVV